MNRAILIVALAPLVGCGADVDAQWQLDHERIIAVRATPPGIVAGGQARIDALLGHKGAPTEERAPELAAVVSPMSLAGAVSHDATGWVVTAPSEMQLAAARAELKLAPDAAVPLVVGVSYAQMKLTAVKTVMLGVAADNPSVASATVDGVAAASSSELIVAPVTDVRLHVDATDADTVNWLTSCGTMHDFDLPNAYLRVETADPQTGELGVVVRDDHGGVAWRVWPIRATN